jgi:hypothetical protein
VHAFPAQIESSACLLKGRHASPFTFRGITRGRGGEIETRGRRMVKRGQSNKTSKTNRRAICATPEAAATSRSPVSVYVSRTYVRDCGRIGRQVGDSSVPDFQRAARSPCAIHPLLYGYIILCKRTYIGCRSD